MITTTWYSECADRGCVLRTASPHDLLAWHLGGDYRKAGAFVSARISRFKITADESDALARRRRVMMQWLKFCRAGTTLGTAASIRSVMRSGGHIIRGQESACILSSKDLAVLNRLASSTGAKFSGGDLDPEVTATLAFAVQTAPWRIDHIILEHPKKSAVISWAQGRSGFGGMIGMAAFPSRKFAASPAQALMLQNAMVATGNTEEIGFWKNIGLSAPALLPVQSRKMIMVVDSPRQMVDCSRVLGGMSLDDIVMSCSSRSLAGIAPDGNARLFRWGDMRVGFILSTILPTDKSLSPEAVQVMETSAPSSHEVGRLANLVRKTGRLRLANQIDAQLDNQLIDTDGDKTVRETASSYVVSSPTAGDEVIANFSLRFHNNLYFADSAEIFHIGRVNCGKSSYEVIFPQTALDSSNGLQTALRYHHATKTKVDATPTIHDPTPFKKYVMKHLRRQSADLKRIAGVTALGWSIDRKVFYLPGMVLDMDGRSAGPSRYHPNMPALRMFEETLAWPDVCTTELPPAARDLIAMILAQCVRYFLRMPTHPICVDQASPARILAISLSEALGQKDVFTTSVNNRESQQTPGVRGYPLLAHGYSYQQAQMMTTPVVLLTDGGYSGGSVEDFAGTLDAMGRTMQYSLVRVAEWMMSGEVSEFLEVPSVEFNNSLIREGRWLMDRIQLRPWEMPDFANDPLDAWLATMGYDRLCRDMRLTADSTVVIPAEMCTAGLADALRKIDPMLVEGEEITTNATRTLVAFSRFFGRELLVELQDA